jgi:hypothetical protein
VPDVFGPLYTLTVTDVASRRAVARAASVGRGRQRHRRRRGVIRERRTRRRGLSVAAPGVRLAPAPAGDRSPDPFQVRSRPINLESIRGASDLRLAADRGYAEPPSGPLDLSSGLGHKDRNFNAFPDTRRPSGSRASARPRPISWPAHGKARRVHCLRVPGLFRPRRPCAGQDEVGRSSLGGKARAVANRL